MGPPASGKGTQAERLARELGLPLLVTGEMLRRAVADGTPVGMEARGFMDQGLLVPDQVLNRLVAETLARPEYRDGFILDGYPRTVAQADFLGAMGEATGTRVSHALYIQVPDEELVRRQAGRLVCRGCGRVYNRVSLPPASEGRCDGCGGELYQRSDDSEATIRTRLRVYREQTAPLVDYYAARGVLHVIDGVGSPAEVGLRLAGALGRGGGAPPPVPGGGRH